MTVDNATILGIQTVRDLVDDIANLRDPEERHSLEDSLYLGVLQTIAAGVSVQHAMGLASAALKTAELDFPRWCA